MKKVYWIACFLVSVVLLSGCGTTGKFVYPSKADNLVKLYEKPKYDLTIAVLPFDEERGDKNDFSGVFLYMIPLMPYGTINYQRPDSAEMFNTISKFNFDVSEDLAKAVVTSLKRSNLFKDVFFTYGGEKKNADLYISGEVKETLWEGKTYSYCLSVVGPVLWFFGLPAGSSHSVLSLNMFLNKENAEAPLWQYAFTKDETTVQGLYYNWGYDCRSFVTLMEQGMNEALKDLDCRLSNIEKDLKKTK